METKHKLTILEHTSSVQECVLSLILRPPTHISKPELAAQLLQNVHVESGDILKHSCNKYKEHSVRCNKYLTL